MKQRAKRNLRFGIITLIYHLIFFISLVNAVSCQEVEPSNNFILIEFGKDNLFQEPNHHTDGHAFCRNGNPWIDPPYSGPLPRHFWVNSQKNTAKIEGIFHPGDGPLDCTRASAIESWVRFRFNPIFDNSIYEYDVIKDCPVRVTTDWSFNIDSSIIGNPTGHVGASAMLHRNIPFNREEYHVRGEDRKAEDNIADIFQSTYGHLTLSIGASASIGAYSYPGYNGSYYTSSTVMINSVKIEFPDIYGVVTNNYTGSPIENAIVQLGSNITNTDSNGFYSFLDIESGEYNLKIEKEGFLIYYEEDVPVDSESNLQKDILLSPGFTIQYSPDKPCINDPITFHPISDYLHLPDFQFSWDFGDGHQGEDLSIVHSYSDPSEYTITLTVRDSELRTVQVITEAIKFSPMIKVSGPYLGTTPFDEPILNIPGYQQYICKDSTVYRELTIENMGNSELNVETMLSFLLPPDGFEIVKAPKSVLQCYEKDQIRIKFNPSDKGGYSGLLTIISNDPDREALGIHLWGGAIECDEEEEKTESKEIEIEPFPTPSPIPGLPLPLPIQIEVWVSSTLPIPSGKVLFSINYGDGSPIESNFDGSFIHAYQDYGTYFLTISVKASENSDFDVRNITITTSLYYDNDDDNDGLLDIIEESSCTNSKDDDSDDDGIPDGIEDSNHNGILDNGETDPCNSDTDGDGILDGTELGYTQDNIGAGTNLNIFIPDADPTTTTDPTKSDTDDDGINDGDEDINKDGAFNPEFGESDPNDLIILGTISGTVTNTEGISVSGINVAVIGSGSEYFNSANTDINGNYIVEAIPPGIYIITTYFPQGIYPPADHGSLVTLTEQQNISGIDIVVEEGGIVSGTTKTNDGSPVEGLLIHANGDKCFGGDYYGPGQTDESGLFSFAVPQGTVYLNADPSFINNPPLIYETTHWNINGGTQDCDIADPISITTGQTTPNIDFTMRPKAPFQVFIHDLQNPDGSQSRLLVVQPDEHYGLNIPDSIGSITVTAADGSVTYTKIDFSYDPTHNAFFIEIDNADIQNILNVSVVIDSSEFSAVLDTDGDGLPDAVEILIGTNMFDADTDDDGLVDGNSGTEDLNVNGIVDPGETDPLKPDTDGDGLPDGLERGLTEPETDDTDLAAGFFIPDNDPSTTTDPTNPDSDNDGKSDGDEDINKDGSFNPELGETNPNFVSVMEMSDHCQLIYSRMMFNRRTGEQSVDVALKNISSRALTTPLKVVIKNISVSTVDCSGTDGSHGEDPYYEYDTDSGILSQGETCSRRWIFHNPTRRRFTYDAVVYGVNP